MKVYLHFVNFHKVQSVQKEYSVGCTEIYIYVIYSVFVKDEMFLC